MINLSKLTVPTEIEEKIKQRQQRYNELDASGEQIPDSLASAYRAPEVKELLRHETAEKCAYCESKVLHVDYGDVEHLLPKSKFPHLRYIATGTELFHAVFAAGKRGIFFRRKHRD